MKSDVFIDFRNSPNAQGTEVFVDGNKVNGIRKLELIAETNDIVRLRLEIIPGDLTIASKSGQTFKADTVLEMCVPLGDDGDVIITDEMAERALKAYDDYLEGPTRPDHSSINLMRHTLQQAFRRQE